MRLSLFVALMAFCCGAHSQDLLSSQRQAQALQKLNKIILPTDLKRIVDSSDTKVSQFCTSRNESMMSIDPNTGEEMLVQLTTYTSLNSEKTVIVLPQTGGVNQLDHKYATAFCKSGMNAIILLTWQGDMIKQVDPGMHDRNALRAMAAIRSLLVTIDQKQKVGMFGTSVGGILGALATGLEKRIETGLFIVAGAGMTKIMSESDEKNLTELRNLRMKHFDLKTEGDYMELLDNNVVIDPLDFASYSGNKKAAFIVSDYDSTVPTSTQYDLVNVWGGEHLIFKRAPVFFNHFAAIVHSSLWWTQDVTDYFQQNL